MKRILAIIFVLAMSLCLFAGCGSDSSEQDKTADSTSGTGNNSVSTVTVEFSKDDINLLENNKARYAIIRGSADDTATSISAYLYKQTKSKLNASFENTTDSKAADSNAYEILVGNTNRPESVKAREYLLATTGGKFDDFLVASIGKKIVIYAFNPETLDTAAKYFVDNFVKNETIKGGIAYTNNASGDFTATAINENSLAEYRIVRPHFNTSYITQLQMEEMQETLYKSTGYKPAIVDDNIAAAEYEIIVGNTSREGVEKVADHDAYTIKVAGKKVYLNGGSPYSIGMAVSEFAKMLSAGKVTDANSTTGSYNTAVASYDKTKYYTPTWTDDFDGVEGGVNGIDTNKWRVLVEGEDDAKAHNDRISVRTARPDVTFVSDGQLHIRATFDDKYYYGAKLKTDTTMTYKYGYLEESCILPHGDGFWTSLWANSGRDYMPEEKAYFTEINVIECFGSTYLGAPNAHGWAKSASSSAFRELWQPLGYPEHWSLDEKYSSAKTYRCPDNTNFNSAFHTFGYLWTEDKIAFTADGKIYFELPMDTDPVYADTLSQPIHLILSEAVCFATGAGKPMADDAEAWTETNNFDIDYVHIYQLNDGKSEMNIQ